jgi:hypothetical protein
MEESILWISGRSRSSTAFSRGIVFVVLVAADNAKKVKREFWKEGAPCLLVTWGKSGDPQPASYSREAPIRFILGSSALFQTFL